MKILAAVITSFLAISCQGEAHAQETRTMDGPKLTISREDVRSVAPAIDRYTQDRLLGDVWKRPGLAPRDA